MRKNHTVNLLREPPQEDFDTEPIPYSIQTELGAYIRFETSSSVTLEGEIVSTDGVAEFASETDVKAGDILEIFPDLTKKYRIVSLNEILSGSGRLSKKSCVIARDHSRE